VQILKSSVRLSRHYAIGFHRGHIARPVIAVCAHADFSLAAHFGHALDPDNL
jgi:hypothetical protein